MFTTREIEEFSLTRALAGAANRGVDGLEKELLHEASSRAELPYGPHAFVVPWELLQRRDVTAAGAPNLVGTETQQPIDILRPFSLAAQAGVRILPNQQASLSYPKVSASVTAQWLTGEADPITASESTVGEIPAAPHIAGAMTIVSHQMGKQAISGDFVGDHLLRLIGATLDAAILAGSGAAGQPQGILGLTDVQTVTGTSLGIAGVAEMEQKSAEANAQPSGYLTTPAVRKLLKTREAAAGSGFIWNAATMNGLPGYATTSAPTAIMYCGPWEQVLVPLWGPGPQLAVDPSTHFNTGRYQVRVLLTADVVVQHAAAFVTASSIT